MIGKRIIHTISALLSVSLLTACTVTEQAADNPSAASSVQMMELNSGLTDAGLDDAYRTTYEVFVYSFCDSNNDGIGDIQGLISKLDYIKDSGYNAIWLMPVCPSPTYHKYDVTDYTDIDPQYGTIDDFDQLIKECDSRGINVITDLVLNHTSSQHPWFLEAKKYLQELPQGWDGSKDYCKYFDYFKFQRESADGFAPIEGTDWYYEARFWSEMPDLNLDSPEVREEIVNIMKFWLDHGVSGFRLDAVTSYYTGRNEDNIEFLRWLVNEGKSIDKDCYFVAEGWTDRNTFASYYASGIDSMFDFSFATNDGVIAQIVKGTDAKIYAEAQVREQDLFSEYSSTWINAPFYTNHDIPRSAGYYPGDDGSKTKFAGAMNLFMSGNAFVYYGEELGMKGSGKDENKRAPMYWSDSPDAKGMCKGPEGMDEIKMVFPSLEQQKDDPLSVYNYYVQAAKIRNAFPEISHGKVTVLTDLCKGRLCIYTKEYNGKSVLIAMNISAEEAVADLSSAAEYSHLAAALNTSEEKIVLDGSQLTLPAWSIAVLNGE